MKNLFRVFLIVGIVVGGLASLKLLLDLVGTHSKAYIGVHDDPGILPY